MSATLRNSPTVPQTAGDVFEFPATLGQRRFWLLDQLQPGDPAFNMPLAFDLRGPLDAASLERALREIVRRHEILRTTFAPATASRGAEGEGGVVGELRQIVAESGEPGWSVADLSGIPSSGGEGAERAGRLDAEILAEARRSFSLAQGPLIRGRLLRLGPEEHVLLVTMHHIVCDGWSNGILVRELAALYEAFSSGRPSPLPDLPIQYADYACWQKEWLESQKFDEAVSWWRERLRAPLAEIELPVDRPRRPGWGTAGVITSRLLPAELSRALKALGRREDATMFMVFLAAFQTLLSRYTGKEDVILCSPSANRHPAETEGLIGAFAHPLILRTDLSGNPSFRDALARVRDCALGAFDHQGLPFERLVEVLDRGDRGSGSVAGAASLPRIMFIYQTAFMRPVELPQLSLTPRRSVSPGSQFEIVLSVVERAEGHRLQIEYNPDLHDAETIATLLSHLENLLAGAAEKPEARLADLPLGTEAGGDVAAMRVRAEPPRTAAAPDPGPPTPAPTPGEPTEGESRLVKIWEKVLGVSPIGVDDDYFELGGHSLLAVQLMTEIQRSLGHKLQLAALVQAPTVRQMAALIAAPEFHERRSSLVPIQAAGSRPPFYLVHAVGGNILNYIDLARHLSEDQPVYGLQARALDANETPHTRVTDMAAHYVEAIRGMQPNGPYYLGGTSAGGLVVFEMAQQLVAAGEEVGVLALFDAWAPGYPRRVPGLTPVQVRWNRLRSRVDLHLGNFLAAKGFRAKAEYLWRKIFRARRAAYVAVRSSWYRVRDPIRGFVNPLPKALREIENATRKASDAYAARPYPGRITLFRATKQPSGIYPDPYLGWASLAVGGIDAHDVPGHHGAIVYEPRVGVLAAQLDRCLLSAQEVAQEEARSAAEGRLR